MAVIVDNQMLQGIEHSNPSAMGEDMEPRFAPVAIPQLVQRYWNYRNAASRQREGLIIENRAPAIRQRGHLIREDLIELTRWKSPRPLSCVERNNDAFIQEVTKLALLPQTSEELRIKSLQIFDGIQWAMASVILHFGFEDRCPIVDFRALWSLQVPETVGYTLDLWLEYTAYCRSCCGQHHVTMRDFDRALWTHSKQNQ